MNREQIKQLAIATAKEVGLVNLSRRSLCDAAGVADGSFTYITGCNFSEFIAELKAEGHGDDRHQVSKKRVPSDMRKETILAAAIIRAKKDGYLKVTRGGVASEAGVSASLVSKYFGTMTQLRRDIMRAAVRQGIPEIVAQGLICGDAHAKKAPTELKEKAANYLRD